MRSYLSDVITQNSQSGHSRPHFGVIATSKPTYLDSTPLSLESSRLRGVLLNFHLLRYHPLFLRVTGMTGMSTQIGVLTEHTQISYSSAQTQTLHFNTHKHSTENKKCLLLIIHASHSGCFCQTGGKELYITVCPHSSTKNEAELLTAPHSSPQRSFHLCLAN